MSTDQTTLPQISLDDMHAQLQAMHAAVASPEFAYLPPVRRVLLRTALDYLTGFYRTMVELADNHD